MSVPATDNLFWHQVIEGYNQVAIEKGRSIRVARDNKEAHIVYKYQADNVAIYISEAKTETVEPLPVP